MILKNIELNNYRNYSKIKLDLDPSLNILIGNNAQGKTNILESIYVISLSKSFLSNNDKNLIKFGSDFARIVSNADINNSKKRFEIVITNCEKKLSINKKKINKISDYVLNLKVISFGPSELKLITDSPSGRRKFMNISLSQLDNSYFKLLSDFNSILRMRNEYLKNIKKNNYKTNTTYLDVINEKYVDLCVKIYYKRKDFIDKLNSAISEKYCYITGNSGLFIKYISSLNSFSEKEIKKSLLNKLVDNYEKEILYGISLYGVHRDDFSFYLNDKDLIEYGSQGQKRVAVLSLKLSELYLFEELINDKPILLLDDLFSELDITKQNSIIKGIDKNIQTFITTTDLEKIDKDLLENAKIFKIDDGKVDEIYGRK